MKCGFMRLILSINWLNSKYLFQFYHFYYLIMIIEIKHNQTKTFFCMFNNNHNNYTFYKDKIQTYNFYYLYIRIVFPYLTDITISGNATNHSITSIPEALDFLRDMAAIVSPK